jgi:phenylalanyl-tRNA synthetase beta chain
MFNEGHRAEHKLRRFLSQAKGMSEIHDYSWNDDRWLSEINYHPPDPFLTLQNPTSPYKSRLRQTLIPGLLQCIRKNYDTRQEVGIYEIGHCYWPKGENDNLESTLFAAALFKAGGLELTEKLYQQAKGIFEDCARILNAPAFEYEIIKKDASPWALANTAVAIKVAGKKVGSLGYMAGAILNAFKRNANIAWLEIDLPALTGPAFPEVNCKPQSEFPISWMDISILFPKAKGFQALQDILENFSHKLVMRRQFITFYEDKNLGQGMRSYTFRYVIGSFERTLSSEDIEDFRASLLKYLRKSKLELRA